MYKNLTIVALIGLFFAGQVSANSHTDPDFNDDGIVNLADYSLFRLQWNTKAGGPNWDAKFDLNGDGVISLGDYAIFRDNWGKTFPVSPSGGGNTYGVGDALPNFPSGFFTPRRVSGASFSYSGGRAVLGFNNGGIIELQDGTTYTCIASGGCGIEDGRVTSGTIRVTTGSSGGGGGGSSGSPDLVVDSPSVDNSSPDAGEYIRLSATVRNQGTGSGTYTLTTLRYYQSTDATISTSDQEVGTSLVSSLAAGETSAESDRVRAPSSPGTYYYGACVESVSGESDTGNNCSSAVTVTIGSPDLVVESPSVSNSSPNAGEYFTLSVTVRNQGTGRTSHSLLTLDYYQSTDATISTSDQEVGTSLVSSLAAGETSAESGRVRAPSSAGTYYYGACIKSVSGESNANNNCSDGVRVTVSSSIGSGGGSGGACTAGLVVNPSESCTYKSYTFSVSSSGRGSIAFFSAGTGIDARGTTINGVRWNFYATKNSGSNSWTIHTAD